MDTVLCDREAVKATFDCAAVCAQFVPPASHDEDDAAPLPSRAPKSEDAAQPEAAQAPAPASARPVAEKSPWAEWFWLGLHRIRASTGPRSVAANPSFVHVRIDAFYASIEQLLNPRLQGQPVLVGRRVVASASPEARAQGVKAGMSVREARKICPQGVVLRGRPKRYARLATRVRGVLDAYTPLVETAAADNFHVELNMANAARMDLRGTLLRLQREIFKHTGLNASIGVATTKRAASLAARLPGAPGIRVVGPKEEAAFLRSIPVELLEGVRLDKVKWLKAHGIRTIGELRAVPKPALMAAFGEAAGQQLWRSARGMDLRRPGLAARPGFVSRAVAMLAPLPCFSR